MTSVVARLRCEAVSWVTTEWPGWVRVRLIDAEQQSWFFVDKFPIFFDHSATDKIELPAPAHIRCEIVDQDEDQVVTVSTAAPDGVEAEDGTSQFRVHLHQIERQTV